MSRRALTLYLFEISGYRTIRHRPKRNPALSASCAPENETMIVSEKIVSIEILMIASLRRKYHLVPRQPVALAVALLASSQIEREIELLCSMMLTKLEMLNAYSWIFGFCSYFCSYFCFCFCFHSHYSCSCSCCNDGLHFGWGMTS
mmetsp:Transcript_11531/g.21953  ORF Transcript_11531/g.21953 Transcript_11531/m.21953 type:complete len:146 (-) Transcript_11531:1437-1874(-)